MWLMILNSFEIDIWVWYSVPADFGWLIDVLKPSTIRIEIININGVPDDKSTEDLWIPIRSHGSQT